MPCSVKETVIKIDNVSKSFNDVEGERFSVFEGLTFSITSGERYALMGPSGAGKSTVLSIITGSQNVDYGSVQIFGKDVVKATSANSLQITTGSMPQLDVNLAHECYQELSGMDTLLHFGKQQGLTAKDIINRFRVFGTEAGRTLLKSKLRFLSVPERRLVYFFSIAIQSPKLLLLDEPTVGLDEYWKKAVWNTLDDLSSQGTTVLVVTHDPEEAMRANKIGFLRRGRIVLEGNPHDLLSSFSAEGLEDVLEQVGIQDELTKICMEQGLANSVADLSELFSLTMDMAEAKPDI